jgi:signal transduction histidine kinase/DNA-binding response OmpR family regulator
MMITGTERQLDYSEFPILYVDDEPENLRVFELTFGSEFQVITATDAEKGLEILSQRPVALILSDHRMPGTTGVEFLAKVHELDESTVRILVTAYGDASTLESAINNGSIYRFVAKPWVPEEMRVTLRNGIERYALEKERGGLLRQLTLLGQISKSMNKNLDSQKLLDLVLSAIVDDLEYDAAGVLFHSQKDQSLSWVGMMPADSSISGALEGLSISREGAPLFFEKLYSGESQILKMEDVMELETPIRKWITEVAAEQIFVTPMKGKNGTIGALVVDNRRGGARFSIEDESLLEGLAAHAVIAIENARMVEDLRQSREQIVRADRLGTLGTLAAGLAHEINNPLVSIHTFLSMAPAKRDENDEEFWGEYHKLACQEVDRIRRLVKTMRGLGRETGESPTKTTVDLSGVVQDVAKLLAREACQAKVGIAIDAAEGVPKIAACQDHMQQVFMNLILNAIHASPQGSEIEIKIIVDRDRDTVSVAVIDQGSGISEENLERIFDPFFTTKGPDQGSGLGLMICHRLVADHHGEIRVASTPGQGTSFEVVLPVGELAAAGASWTR